MDSRCTQGNLGRNEKTSKPKAGTRKRANLRRSWLRTESGYWVARIQSATEWNWTLSFLSVLGLLHRKNGPRHHTGAWKRLGGQEEGAREERVTFGHPQGVPLRVNESHYQRVWQLEATLEIIPNRSIYRSGNRDWPVSVRERDGVRGGPGGGLSQRCPPCLGPREWWALGWYCWYIFFYGDKYLPNHNLEPEPAGRKPNLSFCFQFCQVKRVKISSRTASTLTRSRALNLRFY